MTSMFDACSPLQRIGDSKRLLIKREDLLLPGGGNKVRRFRTFFAENPLLEKVVVLSNPGSHSFKILKHFLRAENQQFVYLERRMKMSNYEQQNRLAYYGHPAIQVEQAALWKQLLKWLYYKYADRKPKTGVLGIGGHVQARIEPFAQAMIECEQQLVAHASLHDLEITKVMHVFPISSGQMLDGFLQARKRTVFEHHFTGVMTGDRLTHVYLPFKYRRYAEVTLLKPQVHSIAEYEQFAHEFKQKTGVWLDPIHTIHLLDQLKRASLPNAESLTVFWMTSPLVEDDPGYQGVQPSGE